MDDTAGTNWYVYMVECADETFYTGIATDVERRVGEHNNDRLLSAKYTRTRRPVTLVYQEALQNRSQAAKREHEIKKMSRQQKSMLISNPLLNENN